MSNPLISVVLPLYNREKYIEESIRSILNQTVEDFELLVIDDASTDSSVEVVKGIKDPRIRLFIKLKNEGVATTINIGFREARGRFIARMDSDDISFPKRFEKQLKVLQHNPELVVCGSWIVKDNGELLKFKETHEEIHVDMLNRCALSMGTALVNKGKLDGLLLKEGLRHGEDYEFWSRIILQGNYYNIQEPLLYYRSHEAQLSTLHKPEQILMDADIKLAFLKKLSFDTIKFPYVIIKKILTLNEYFTPGEFVLFLKWLNEIRTINKNKNIFSIKEFNSFILNQRHSQLINLYFKKNEISIDKKWRIIALFRLPLQDSFYILKLKSREIRKRILKANEKKNFTL
jgi:glycosyltransferase involved in cell wall biosynthesis